MLMTGARQSPDGGGGRGGKVIPVASLMVPSQHRNVRWPFYGLLSADTVMARDL